MRSEVSRSRTRFERGDLDGPMRWKVTLNRYPSTLLESGSANKDLGRSSTHRRSGVVGFPWHRDLIANGACSLILDLGSPGHLEFGFAPDDDKTDGIKYSSDHSISPGTEIKVVERVQLEDGDLLVLTGAARWEALHRVILTEADSERVSLVFGAW